MNAFNDQITLLRLESERLSEYLQKLPVEAWQRQSACDRWNVADVVAHLNFGAQFYEECISRGLRGDTSPPEGLPPPGEADPAVMGEVIAQGAISAGRLWETKCCRRSIRRATSSIDSSRVFARRTGTSLATIRSVFYLSPCS